MFRTKTCASSEGELHQTRVQNQREEKVGSDHQREWPYGRERCDLPVVGNQMAERSDASKHDHGGDHDEAEKEGEFEAA